jgi:hypothetical protein
MARDVHRTCVVYLKAGRSHCLEAGAGRPGKDR